MIPLAQLAIFLGMGDVAAIRRALEACIADTTPVQPVRTVLGPFLDQFRHDRDIDRMLERDSTAHGRSNPRARKSERPEAIQQRYRDDRLTGERRVVDQNSAASEELIVHLNDAHHWTREPSRRGRRPRRPARQSHAHH